MTTTDSPAPYRSLFFEPDILDVCEGPCGSAHQPEAETGKQTFNPETFSRGAGAPWAFRLGVTEEAGRHCPPEPRRLFVPQRRWKGHYGPFRCAAPGGRAQSDGRR